VKTYLLAESFNTSFDRLDRFSERRGFSEKRAVLLKEFYRKELIVMIQWIIWHFFILLLDTQISRTINVIRCLLIKLLILIKPALLYLTIIIVSTTYPWLAKTVRLF